MRTRPLIAAVAGTAFAVAAGLVAMTPATGAISGLGVDILQPPGTGVITLATAVGSGNGSVTYAGIGSWVGPQSLTATSNNCQLVSTAPAGSGNLLSFSGNILSISNGGTPSVATSKVGYSTSSSAGSIGVFASNGNNCSAVNYSKSGRNETEEQLVIDLGLGNIKENGTPVAGLKATSARFDIESKGSAIVKADFTDNGTVVDTRYLYTGSSTIPASRVDVATKCGKTAVDNGSDAGSSDNCQWTVAPSASFTGVVMTAIGGASFSVEGGGDWGSAAAAANTTQFNVGNAQGILDCGGSTTTASSTTNGVYTEFGGERLVNGDGSACTLLPYSISAQNNVCQFTKPLNIDPTAQFLLTCVRTILPTSSNGVTDPSTYSGDSLFVADPTPNLQVSWPDGLDKLLDMTYCPASLYNVGANTWDYDWLEANKDGSATTNGTDMSPMTGLQYACIKSEASAPSTKAGVPNGAIQVTDVVYFTGDILLTTKK